MPVYFYDDYFCIEKQVISTTLYQTVKNVSMVSSVQKFSAHILLQLCMNDDVALTSYFLSLWICNIYTL